MNKIWVTHDSSAEHLADLSLKNWPIWEKDVSELPWPYDELETCYILEGEGLVTPYRAELSHIAKGDWVVFPAGMSCRWQIFCDISKHYQFG